MSLIKKSDVKNHLSTRNSVRPPFGIAPKPAAVTSEPAPGSQETDLLEDSSRPLHPIGAEPIANAQVGGSIGVPTGEPWRPRKL
jgi:hypothetical protein